MTPLYKTEVFLVAPKDFRSQIDVVACYMHTNAHFLLLHRAKGKPQEYTWGVPAGKVEKGESLHQAIIREVEEETGIHLENESLKQIGTLYVRYPHIDFTYHMFEQHDLSFPEVQLSEEHHDYCWVTVEDALKLPLISGGKEALDHFLAASSMYQP